MCLKTLALDPARPPKSCDGTCVEADSRGVGDGVLDPGPDRWCTDPAPDGIGCSELDLVRSLRRDVSRCACGRRSDCAFGSRWSDVSDDESEASARSVVESETGDEDGASGLLYPLLRLASSDPDSLPSCRVWLSLCCCNF